MNMHNVLVVDDEPLARKRITSLLAENGIENVRETSHGAAAIDVILEQEPDLLFLDIQMPECSGFEVLEQLPEENLPVIIFVTAHDQFALKAFEAHALDYLLKPFDDERFADALARAIELIDLKRTGESQLKIQELLASVTQQKSYQEHFLVKLPNRAVIVKTESIDWIESAANYVRFHVGDQSYLLRATMAEMERKLDPSKFMRIHRSAIVNISAIKELQPWSHGDYVVVLNDDQQLKLSRYYRKHVRDRIGGYF